MVPTHHHQGIGRLAEALTATAWAEDGTIEAVEMDAPFVSACSGIQRRAMDLALFDALIEASHERRTRGR